MKIGNENKMYHNYVKSLRMNFGPIRLFFGRHMKIKWVNFNLIDIQHLRAAVLIEDVLENVLASIAKIDIQVDKQRGINNCIIFHQHQCNVLDVHNWRVRTRLIVIA